jgi:uncharacterized membrane protein
MSRRRSRASTPAASEEKRTGPATRHGGALAPSADVPTRTRIDAVDALRGGALCLMIVYHFAFDLRAFGVTRTDFEHDPFWLSFRAVIVGSFMALVGVSLVLADKAHAPPRHFWRRVAIIAACALLVSAASFLAFRPTFIYFGILHAIAVATVLVSPLVRRPRAALAFGAAVVVAGIVYANPVFDARWLSWIGFVTTKPSTEDYVPLAPWAGVVALGIAAGDRLARNGFRALAPLGRAPAWLGWLGRHSLLVYMIHQPLLLGALWLVVRP